MKKEKNRKQEIMNSSFFNRNYPSLFCYREKHTMTKCLKRSLNALPQLFSQIFPNPLPHPPKKTTKYKTMSYRDFHAYAYYSIEIKIKTLLLLSLFIRKKNVHRLRNMCLNWKEKEIAKVNDSFQRIFYVKTVKTLFLNILHLYQCKKQTNGQLSMFPCIDHLQYFRYWSWSLILVVKCC